MSHRRSQAARIRNLGPTSTGWLHAVGIYTIEDLERAGSVLVYKMVEQHGFAPSLNLLYSMEAAIRDIDWRELPAAVKEQLKVSVRD
jgi:DNA transformation protein